MRLAAAFALVALAPAALAAAPSDRTVVVALCSGAVHAIPMRQRPGDDDRGNDGNGCCAVACHAAGSRKRTGCHN